MRDSEEVTKATLSKKRPTDENHNTYYKVTLKRKNPGYSMLRRQIEP